MTSTKLEDKIKCCLEPRGPLFLEKEELLLNPEIKILYRKRLKSFLTPFDSMTNDLSSECRNKYTIFVFAFPPLFHFLRIPK